MQRQGLELDRRPGDDDGIRAPGAQQVEGGEDRQVAARAGGAHREGRSAKMKELRGRGEDVRVEAQEAEERLDVVRLVLVKGARIVDDVTHVQVVSGEDVRHALRGDPRQRSRIVVGFKGRRGDEPGHEG